MSRFSNPSSSIGVNRFHVWPLGADQYTHADLAGNWDKLDAMFGVPSNGTSWPVDEGVDAGIYKQVRLLQLERQPIGTVVPWWRPSASVPIPVSWTVCDGSILTPAQHNFPGIAGSVTLPDLRNCFILGADPTKPIATAAAPVGDSTIDLANGAPGIGATGGSNQHILTSSEMPVHTHTATSGSHTHALNDPGHAHNISATSAGAHTHGMPFGGVIYGNIGLFSSAGKLTGSGASIYEESATASGGAHTHNGNTDARSSNITLGNSVGSTSIDNAGGGTAHENRPLWVGLVYLMKTTYISTLT